jgi:radical SAM superfamily enzyme with C-terminal helix-hairpin-helix motif
MPDTIVEEVRKARDDYARQFSYDLHAMCADLRHEQKLSGAQIVSFPRRPVRVSPLDRELNPAGNTSAK